jgi:hypothetical protein
MSVPKGWKSKPGEQITAKGDASYGSTQYLMLGLTDDNIAYLKAGNSIGVDLQDLGYPGAPHKVILTFGKTHDDAANKIKAVTIVQMDLDPTKMPRS